MVIAPHRKQQAQPGRRRTDGAAGADEASTEDAGAEAASA
jgi:hypothetical protein